MAAGCSNSIYFRDRDIMANFQLVIAFGSGLFFGAVSIIVICCALINGDDDNE